MSYETVCFTERCQFPAHINNKNIRNPINFLQQEYPEKYSNRSTAESFFYHTIKKHKEITNLPHLDPFRERRGENKPKSSNPSPNEKIRTFLNSVTSGSTNQI